jgi:hypothetical protein
MRYFREMEWFNRSLPEYLKVIPETLSSFTIDEKLVAELQKKLQISNQEIITKLKDKEKNSVKIAYQLAYDHQKMKANSETFKFQMDFFSSSPPVVGPLGDIDKIDDEPLPPSSIAVLGSISNAAILGGWPQSKSKKHKKRGKWHFGIRSRGSPKKIMYEIYKAMKNIGLEWKPLDPFSVRCRWSVDSEVLSKFEIRLLKVDSTNFVVDFQNVIDMEHAENAKVFNFFDICCRLMFELSISD